MVPGYCVNTHLHKARNLDVAHQSVLLCFIPTMSEEINLLCVNQEWLDCALKQNSNSWSLPKQGPPRPRSLILLEIRHGLVRGLTLDYSYVGRAKGDSIIKNSHPQLFWHQEPMLL